MDDAQTSAEPPMAGGGRWRSVRMAIAPLLLLTATMVLLAQQHGLLSSAESKTAQPWLARPTAGATIGLGVTTGVLARNAWTPWKASDLRQVNAFEQAAHRHVNSVMYYADWQHNRLSTTQLDAIARRGSIPEITWEPWNAETGIYQPQPQYTLHNIIAGRLDRYIRSWAVGLARWGRPVRLRFAQEMNGGWYPWSERANGNRPGEYVRAWRHIHHIFTVAGARNVRWVWNPVRGAPRHFFPGRGEVDVLGITCLNGGESPFGGGWRSFARICGRSISALHRLAPELPIEISEAGSTELGGNKAYWIAGMFSYLNKHPVVRSVVWFNLNKETNWTITSSPAALRQFARGVNSGRFR